MNLELRRDIPDDAVYDVVILGAGVAGAAAAILAGRQSLKTLLVESKSFPREKVCGGCLNLRSQGSLERLGVLHRLQQAGAVRIDSMRLQIRNTRAQWRVPVMMSVRRSTLDAILVEQAVAEGVAFIDRTQGTLQPTGTSNLGFRSVRLQSLGDVQVVQARCVLNASGLTRSSLGHENNWPAAVETNSRVGVQTLIPCNTAGEFADGRLHMLVGTRGYVGLCKTDGDWVDIAAAIDPASIQRFGGIRQVVQGILTECGIQSPVLPTQLQWLATPALTRSSARVADHRTFLLGDAIGYVEPFTGEGMSWALASAESVMPIVAEIIASEWDDSLIARWSEWTHRQRTRKHKTCRWIAGKIRWPRSAAVVLRACDWLMPLRASFLRKTAQ